MAPSFDGMGRGREFFRAKRQCREHRLRIARVGFVVFVYKGLPGGERGEDVVRRSKDDTLWESLVPCFRASPTTQHTNNIAAATPPAWSQLVDPNQQQSWHIVCSERRHGALIQSCPDGRSNITVVHFKELSPAIVADHITTRLTDGHTITHTPPCQ